MDEIEKNIKKFLPYLEDLRLILYRGTILFVVMFMVGFLSAGKILKFILKSINIDQVIIATSSPFQFTSLAMNIGFILAIIVTVIYLIFSFYIFIAPALGRREKMFLFKSVPSSMGLFIIGFLYGFGVLYYALQLLASINIQLGIKNIWDIGGLVSQIVVTAIMLGLVFEMPVILSFLIKMRIIDGQFLKDKRRIAYFFIFCLVALLPPTDGLSLLVMSLPLVFLYEITIVLNIISNKKKKYVWTRT